ncbi:MAG: peptide chain release factor N(5)-glutamine methyltransferase [Desulfomonilia bacterium]
MSWTIRSVVSWATGFLRDKGIEPARLEAELLLAHAIKARRIDLYLDFDRPLVPDELSLYKSLLLRRARKEPIAYILGEKEFYGRAFRVNPDVLIPRPETELLVDSAIELAPHGGTFFEIGVGSGAVIISILAHRKDLVGFGNDIRKQAVIQARTNGNTHGVSPRMHLYAGNSLKGLRARFPLIISNPPYVQRTMAGTLEDDGVLYEPREAIFGGKDGLDVIKSILDIAGDHLIGGGVLILEVGFDQKDAVECLVDSRETLAILEWKKDLSGICRTVLIERAYG